MIRFASSDFSQLVSYNTIPALTNATIYIQFVVNDTTGPYVIWKLGNSAFIDYELRIASGVLQFQTMYNMLNGDRGSWTCSVSPGVYYVCGLKYNYAGSDTADPVIYLNGVKQNITETITPRNTNAHNEEFMSVGGSLLALGNLAQWEQEKLGGRLSEFSIHTTQHADAVMERNTISQVKRFIYLNNQADCIMYCPMDDIGDVEYTTTVTDLVPNGDVSGTWATKTQATYSASIDEDGTTDYIEAAGSDDGQSLVFDMTTLTIPAGYFVAAIKIGIKGYSEGAEPDIDIRMYKGSTWLDYWTIASNFAGSSVNLKTFEVTNWSAGNNTWSQADLNGLRLEIKADATMAKSDRIRIYYAYAKVYLANKYIKDWSGNNRHLISRYNTGGGEALSYP